MQIEVNKSTMDMWIKLTVNIIYDHNKSTHMWIEINKSTMDMWIEVNSKYYLWSYMHK